MKRVYGIFKENTTKPQTVNFLKNTEIETKEKLNIIKRKYTNSENKNSKRMLDFIVKVFPKFKNNKEDLTEKKFFKKLIVNPILKILLTKMIFKAWVTYAKNHQNS